MDEHGRQRDRDAEAVFGIPRPPSVGDGGTDSAGGFGGSGPPSFPQGGPAAAHGAQGGAPTGPASSPQEFGPPPVGVPATPGPAYADPRPSDPSPGSRFRIFSSWGAIVVGALVQGLMALVQIALVAQTEADIDYGNIMAAAIAVGMGGAFFFAPIAIGLGVHACLGRGLSRGTYIRAGLGAGLAFATCTSSIWFIWIFATAL